MKIRIEETDVAVTKCPHCGTEIALTSLDPRYCSYLEEMTCGQCVGLEYQYFDCDERIVCPKCEKTLDWEEVVVKLQLLRVLYTKEAKKSGKLEMAYEDDYDLDQYYMTYEDEYYEEDEYELDVIPL